MILTARGDYFYFDGPHRFDVGVIAASLSKICRFTGHCREFYSVAQHSVLASEIVPEEFALEALLHDAQEAYIGDVSAPLKRRLIDYQMLEGRIEASLRKWFDLPMVQSPEVKRADLTMLATERRDLMPPAHSPIAWRVLDGVGPLEMIIRPWASCQEAEARFLDRFNAITANDYQRATAP